MLGLMGAGKSTIYEALIRSSEWKRSHGFETAISEKENIFLREARQQSRVHWIFLKLFLYMPRMRDLLVTKNLTQSAWESLWSQQEAFQEIMNLALNKRVTVETHLPLSLLRNRQIIEEIVNVAHLMFHGECEIILHDESLLTRGFGAAMDSGNSEKFIDDWCESVPMPSLVIFVNTPLDIIKERIKGRDNRLSGIHEQKVGKMIGLIERVKQKTLRRQVSILEVDGTLGSVVNAKRCFDFMRTLQP